LKPLIFVRSDFLIDIIFSIVSILVLINLVIIASSIDRIFNFLIKNVNSLIFCSIVDSSSTITSTPVSVHLYGIVGSCGLLFNAGFIIDIILDEV
jgi:hypothetical protein